MATSHEQVRTKVIELLQSNPQGLRYAELKSRVIEALPSIPANTVHGGLWTLTTNPPKGVVKPTRGL